MATEVPLPVRGGRTTTASEGTSVRVAVNGPDVILGVQRPRLQIEPFANRPAGHQARHELVMQQGARCTELQPTRNDTMTVDQLAQVHLEPNSQPLTDTRREMVRHDPILPATYPTRSRIGTWP